ncbi:MAG: hypothetical protein ACLSTO_03585 [Bilophila wadsworthia]
MPSLARSYRTLARCTWPGISRVCRRRGSVPTGTHYKLVERSVKYGVLFIGLTLPRSLCLKWVLGRGCIRYSTASWGCRWWCSIWSCCRCPSIWPF